MIICITGPTGVGKTKLSIMLAKKYKGIVVNADACQVYKGLDIGTAKVCKNEMEGIPHYLLDIVNPNEDYNVTMYQKDLRNIIDNNKDKTIIIVGGSTLYIQAALYDYKFDPMNNSNLDKYSNDELYEMALNLDKDLNIHKNNRRRLINFIKKDGNINNDAKLLYKDTIFIGLTTDRDNLYNIINNRVDEMINKGLVKEVETLYNKYGDSRILKSAIGYKEIIKYLNNEYSLDEAVEEIKKNSRHYAKRQYTWINNKMNIKWFDTNYDDFNKTYEEVIKYIEKDIN